MGTIRPSIFRLNKQAFRLILVAINIAVFLFLLNARQPVQGQADGLLPWVVNAIPTRGEELRIDQDVVFTFNSAMNRDSVEAAFSVSPTATGTLRWQDDTTLTYTPSKALDRDTAYIFQIDSAARSVEGIGLRDTFTLKLRTTGYLAVTQFFPDAESSIDLKPTITIVFNRPVVALGTAEQMQTAASPFTSQPAMTGKGEWLTTSIYTFKPTIPLYDGTNYKITLPTTLTDMSGSPLKKETVFTFKTVSVATPAPVTFSIHYIFPEKGRTKIFRSPRIRVAYDGPADTASAEAGFSLIAPNGRIIPGKFQWDKALIEMSFRPTELLDNSTTYTIKIDRKNIRSKAGMPLTTDARTTFTTLDLAQINRTTPADGSLVDPSASMTIGFSTPMKLDDFATRIEISPKTPVAVLASDTSPDNDWVRVQFSTLPSTTYTVTLNTKGLVDIWGTPLQLPPQPTIYQIIAPDKIQFRYVTSALNPAISLETGGQAMGLYNAYRQTRVFVTHRNINAVGLALTQLSLPRFLNMNYNDARSKDETETLVRRWVAPVYNPPNVMRFDLLSLTLDGTSIGQQGNVVCIEAAPSHLAVGQQVRVVRRELPIDDKTTSTATAAPASINFRNLPGTQNTIVIGQASNGTEFSVLDGPVCADRYVWWKVQIADGGQLGWIAEGDLKQPYVIPVVDAVMETPIQVTPTLTPTATLPSAPTPLKTAGLPPGLYQLTMQAPDIHNANSHIQHMLIVATDNITLKVARREALAWVTDLKSGLPAAGLVVQFYRVMQLERGQKVLPFGDPITTDKDGFARLSTRAELSPAGEVIYATVNSAGHFGIAQSNWTQGIEAADFQQPTMYTNQDIALYLYTDRRLYKPGEKVYFKGTIRNRNDSMYRMSDKKLIPVEVYDSSNKLIYEKKVAVNAYGSFSDSLTIDSGAQLGEYRVIARPNKPDPKPPGTATITPTATARPAAQRLPENQVNDPQFVTQITIGNYTPPEFRVSVTPEAGHVAPGDKIRAKVESSYYFGGAVSDAVVQWQVVTDPYYFYYTGDGAYSFEGSVAKSGWFWKRADLRSEI